MRKSTKAISMFLVAMLVFSSFNCNVYASEPIEKSVIQNEEEIVEDVNELKEEQTVSESEESSVSEEENSISMSETEIVEETVTEIDLDIEEETESEIELLSSEGSEETIIISGSCGENANYKVVLYDNTSMYSLIITGSGEMSDFSMDSNRRTNAPWKDYWQDIRTISISDDITKIGACAFAGVQNAIGEYPIPQKVEKIGDYAFYNCYMLGDNKELSFPSTVTQIGKYAFFECCFSSLQLPDGLITLGDYAFWAGGMSKTSGDLTIPSNLKYVPEGAFGGHTFDGTLTLPATITTGFGGGAFYNTNFTKMVIECTGGSVWTSSPTAYLSNVEPFTKMDYLKEIVFTNGVPDWGSSTGGSNWTCKSPWGLNKDSVEKIIISDGITSIPDNAFRECGNSNCTISIPNTITSIGKYAFEDFEGEGVTIPTALQNAGKYGYAFLNCKSLRDTVIIPETLTTDIDLGGCTNITKVVNQSEQTATLPSISGFVWLNESDNEAGAITTIANGTAVLADENSLNTEIANVRFDANGGTKVSTVIKKCVESTYGVLPCTNKAGYTFLGWFTKKEGGVKVEETTVITTSGDQILYAHWELDPEGDLFSGTCGTGLTWAIKGSGALVISGAGAMTNYSSESPWYSHKDLINKIVVNDGVTTIGRLAFYECKNVEGVELPNSLLTDM